MCKIRHLQERRNVVRTFTQKSAQCRWIGDRKSRVHYVATIVRSQELSPLAPDGPSTLSLRPDRLYRLWVTPRWTTGRNTNTIKPAIACGAWFSWCPRQDSNLRRPGLEEPYSGAKGVFPMRYNPYISMDWEFRNIYAVAPQPPVPWLRGDAVVTGFFDQQQSSALNQ